MAMAKILVTGGPVHTHLDSVKIITNRFKGGRMVALADALRDRGHFITFLGSPHGRLPLADPRVGMFIETHHGFADYRQQVREHAKDHDMVILGAAVANLMPFPPWDVSQKFPSHDYEEGAEIMVPFRVTPRVINEVKRVNPRTTLIGFKLLQGVKLSELIRAARLVSTESNASFVIANDADDLTTKYIVTRERSTIPALDITMGRPEEAYLKSIGAPQLLLADFLDQVARDEHYTTEVHSGILGGVRCRKVRERTLNEALDTYERLIQEHKQLIEKTGDAEGSVFGCIAVEVEGGGFVVSERGKRSLDDSPVYVSSVDHENRRVVSHGGKPSLNAPLLDNVLKATPDEGGVKAVLHHHGWFANFQELDYAPPGTVRDSQRDLSFLASDKSGAFQISHHGVFQVINEVRHA